ncbi:uncharacterized protein PAC_10775 [Phialocephala subalpina]|uniref:Prenylcysteine lyase domain-containing protein n=1 Tax=Phialocephala subalpina TaxID=576137 RepID=A0A1L7X779_9HELO|nr:uncharacterized protein PAC_10775 [Phialocephala subalpina]
MLFPNRTSLLPLLSYFSTNNTSSQSSSSSPFNKQIVIIGPGIAGSTAAYFLQDHLSAINLPVHITIFESESKVGGGISSVKYRGRVIETGVQNWGDEGWCMNLAMPETGPKPKEKAWEMETHDTRKVGIWNGENFVVEEVDSSEFSNFWRVVEEVWKDGHSAWLLRKWRRSWCEMGRSVWRYGSSPLRLRNAILGELGRWKGVGEGLSIPPPRKRPFGTLGEEMRVNGLEGLVLVDASVYLRSLGLSEKFINEVVGPIVRARFGRDLEDVSGLEVLRAVRDILSRSILVEGGNRRLVDRLIKLSDAKVELGKKVKRIEKGDGKRWRLGVESMVGGVEEVDEEEFDVSGEDRDWEYRFTAVGSLSPSFFGLPPNVRILSTVLTAKNSSLASEIYGTTKIDQLHYLDEEGCDPPPGQEDAWTCDDDKHETIYRVLSAEPVDECTLAKMVGKGCDYEIPFAERKTWPGYSRQEGKERWNKEVEVLDGVYSAGGAEGIVDGVEMSCRMGYNAMGMCI